MSKFPAEFSFSLLTGMVLLIIICLVAIGLKFVIMSKLKKHKFKHVWIETLSDAVALIIMFFAVWAAAPLMGYGPNPLFH